MRDQIRRLGADTAVYGISTIVGRFLNFLLVPIYTHLLPPGEYGIVAYVYSIIAFVTIIYGYGMESAYFKYASTKELGDEKTNFSTPFLSLLLTSGIFSLALSLWSSRVATAVWLPESAARIIVYSAGILFFDTVTVVPFASLRLERRAKLFASLKVLNIVINVASNLVLLMVFHTGIEGIFLSGLIASGATAAMILPVVMEKLVLRMPADLYKALLKFGLPYMPAGLAAMMIQVGDRLVMKRLTDDATIGIYQANYRLGIFMMLVVSMYDYAWRPFFLTNAGEPDARTLFARILTYFILAGTAIVLVLSLFMPDLVALRIFHRTIIDQRYWGGLSIVPVVLLGYLFLGVYNNLIAGIYIEKKTRYLPGITAAGAVVNIAVNFALIPVMGMMGAAVATLAAYFVMAGVLYLVVQRFYPVAYEWKRIAMIALAGGATYALYLFLPPPLPLLLWKALLVVLFGLLLWIFGFFNRGELEALRGMLRRAPAGK
jgi:O-antigen/teichoic acid export membrane protein